MISHTMSSNDPMRIPTSRGYHLLEREQAILSWSIQAYGRVVPVRLTAVTLRDGRDS